MEKHTPLDPDRVVTLDMNEHRIMEQGDKVLCGYCCQCGACCIGTHVPYPKEGGGCKRLLPHGTAEDGSTEKFICKVYRIRPVGCALWPEIDDKLPESCTYYWKDKDS